MLTTTVSNAQAMTLVHQAQAATVVYQTQAMTVVYQTQAATVVYQTQAATGCLRERAVPYRSWSPGKSNAPPLAHAVQTACRRLNTAYAKLIAREAEAWVHVSERNLHLEAGYRSLGDYAREVLGTSPRTSRRRIQLGRVLAKSPILKKAFLLGEVGACRAASLIPVLHGTAGDAFWVSLASRVSVKELANRIRQSMANERPETLLDNAGTSDEEAGSTLSVHVPPAMALAWEGALQLARKQMGWEAPQGECFESILAEAETELAGRPIPISAGTASAAHSRGGSSEPARRPVENHRAWAPPRQAVKHALNVLTEVKRELKEFDALLESAEHADPVVLIAILNQLRRPQKLLRGRLLICAQDLAVHLAFGCTSFAAWSQSELGVSERAVRDAVGHARRFARCPFLAGAYVRGTISASAAHLIEGVAGEQEFQDWIERAGHVTHLHLSREARWIQRCHELFPNMIVRGPLDVIEVEKELCSKLHGYGWSRRRVAEVLDEHGLAVGKESGLGELNWRGGLNSSTPPANESIPITIDPAVNPLVLARLEVLLDLCALAAYPDGVTEDAPTFGMSDLMALGDADRDRQTLATPVAAPGHDRQTLAAAVAAPGHDRIRIAIHLSAQTTHQWNRVRVQLSRLGFKHNWTMFGFVVCIALNEWGRVDPDSRPTEHVILTRDDYRCTAPGCSARRNLEVHHIVFRSHGGTDAPSNVTTLCAFHHRKGVHENRAAVTGSAPHALRWRLGRANPGGRGQLPEYFMGQHRFVERP